MGNLFKRLNKESYGVFLVRLKEGWGFNNEDFSQGGSAEVKFVGHRHKTFIVGFYNRRSQLDEKEFSLEIILPDKIVLDIPREAIHDYERLRNLPC
ncbi:MAG: hypothetical protein KKF67_03695 [Nanoarchaeota archaeon]|nr:hypothetical protein [Nanoarchaeota archaeon]